MNLTIKKLKQHSLKYFLFKILIFLFLIYCLDYVIGSFLNFLYFKQKSGELYETTYSMIKTTDDILIFGSSRAVHHYNPAIIEKKFPSLKCYNTGKDGNFIFYNYAILNGVLKRYSPKVAILDFSRKEFFISQEDYDRLSNLLPYYKTHPELQDLIESRGPCERVKLISKIYPFNSLFLSMIEGCFKTGKKEITRKGFIVKNRNWKSPLRIDTNNYTNYKVDSFKIQTFENFIEASLKAKVRLYIIVSPYYIQYKSLDHSVLIANQIANKFNIPFYDFSQDERFLKHKDLFADNYHLNEKGSDLFSNIIADSLDNSLKSYYK